MPVTTSPAIRFPQNAAASMHPAPMTVSGISASLASDALWGSTAFSATAVTASAARLRMRVLKRGDAPCAITAKTAA